MAMSTQRKASGESKTRNLLSLQTIKKPRSQRSQTYCHSTLDYKHDDDDDVQANGDERVPLSTATTATRVTTPKAPTLRMTEATQSVQRLTTAQISSRWESVVVAARRKWEQSTHQHSVHKRQQQHQQPKQTQDPESQISSECSPTYLRSKLPCRHLTAIPIDSETDSETETLHSMQPTLSDSHKLPSVLRTTTLTKFPQTPTQAASSMTPTRSTSLTPTPTRTPRRSTSAPLQRKRSKRSAVPQLTTATSSPLLSMFHNAAIAPQANCPVCHVQLSVAAMPRHVDNCLAAQSPCKSTEEQFTIPWTEPVAVDWTGLSPSFKHLWRMYQPDCSHGPTAQPMETFLPCLDTPAPTVHKQKQKGCTTDHTPHQRAESSAPCVDAGEDTNISEQGQEQAAMPHDQPQGCFNCGDLEHFSRECPFGPYYVHMFSTMVNSVMSNPGNSHLFNEQETDTVSQFNSLPLHARMLFVRLYNRRPAYFTVESLHYPEIETALGDASGLRDAVHCLLDSGFCATAKNQLQSVDAALACLTTAQSRIVCERLHIKVASYTKAWMHQAIMRHGCQQATVYSASSTSRVLSIAKSILSSHFALDASIRALYQRIETLFFMKREWVDNSLSTMFLKRSGKVIYPPVTVDTSPIALFESRQQLILYHQALLTEYSITEARDKGDRTAALKLCKATLHNWRTPDPLPAWVRTLPQSKHCQPQIPQLQTSTGVSPLISSHEKAPPSLVSASPFESLCFEITSPGDSTHTCAPEKSAEELAIDLPPSQQSIGSDVVVEETKANFFGSLVEQFPHVDPSHLNPEHCAEFWKQYLALAFTADAVLTRIRALYVELLESQHEHELAVEELHCLLRQNSFSLSSRGRWFDRLSINYNTHLNSPQAALHTCRQGMEDPHVRTGHKLALCRRAARLVRSSKCPQFQPLQHLFPVPQLSSWPTVKCLGKTLELHQTGEKLTYLHETQALCSVEDFVLLQAQECGWRGVHCEGSFLSTCFTLLFWDVIFADIPGMFRSNFQVCPIDYGTDAFYANRSQMILTRFEELWKSNLTTEVEQAWTQHYAQAAAGVSWTLMSLQDLQDAIDCIGKVVILGACDLFAHDKRHRSGGLPDLLLWRSAPHPAAKFVEVKSPNDTLADKQKIWLHALLELGASVSLCEVTDYGGHRQFLKAATNLAKASTTTP
eukprot:m.338589 g.338589  ORF g.338589 m.338589 type:complete len:1178 (-) comp16086_c0_seq11:173-3706(-)